MNKTDRRILKNLRVVVIVDRTRGGKWRTVYKIKSWPTEEHSPNWTASHRHLRFVKKKETPGTNSFRRREVIRETSIPYTLSICWSRRGDGLNRGTTTSCCIPQTPSIHKERKRRINPNVLLDAVLFFLDLEKSWKTMDCQWDKTRPTIPAVMRNTEKNFWIE